MTSTDYCTQVINVCNLIVWSDTKKVVKKINFFKTTCTQLFSSSSFMERKRKRKHKFFFSKHMCVCVCKMSSAFLSLISLFLSSFLPYLILIDAVFLKRVYIIINFSVITFRSSIFHFLFFLFFFLAKITLLKLHHFSSIFLA